MLTNLIELQTFERIVRLGSLSAAARNLGVGLAVVSKRLASLECRAATQLIRRSTRRLAPTEEGLDLLASIERVLEELAEAEAQLARRHEEPVGSLRVGAPVSLGRRHVAPVIGALCDRHPKLSASLHLSDEHVGDLGADMDVSVRIGMPSEGAAAARKLADGHRILVAAPSFLDRHGRPSSPEQLLRLPAIRFDWARGPWSLRDPEGKEIDIVPNGQLRTDDGDVAVDWAVGGHGLLLKSLIDVGKDVREGKLEHVLPGWISEAAPIYALLQSRRHVPGKVRAFVDAMLYRLGANSAASRLL
jgi:DNA-binding transcriptional LysR family regulator